VESGSRDSEGLVSPWSKFADNRLKLTVPGSLRYAITASGLIPNRPSVSFKSFSACTQRASIPGRALGWQSARGLWSGTAGGSGSNPRLARGRPFSSPCPQHRQECGGGDVERYPHHPLLPLVRSHTAVRAAHFLRGFFEAYPTGGVIIRRRKRRSSSCQSCRYTAAN